MTGKRRMSAQLTFEDRPSLTHLTRLTRDGYPKERPGPKTSPNPNVRHRARAVHTYSNPLHVTLRARPELPSFVSPTLFPAFERAVRTTRRDGFRIVEFAVYDDSMHLIVEADDSDALARGMKSFSVRANRLFNAAHGRGRGPVWADRYHCRELTSASQVRDALVYVRTPKPVGGASVRATEDARTVLLLSVLKQYGFDASAETSHTPS